MAKLVNDKPPAQVNNEQVIVDNGVDKFIKDYTKDLSLLQNQLAIYHPQEKQFYKLGMLDIRGQRFEVFGEAMTRFFRFIDVVLFNYTIPEEFDKYYEHYKTRVSDEEHYWDTQALEKRFRKKKVKSKEKILERLMSYEGRIGHMEGYSELLEQRAKNKDNTLKEKK